MHTDKVVFQNNKGQQLAARLELPLDGQPKQFALFSHCFTCNKNLNAVRNITRALAMNGYGILRFDFTGLGESEGEFEDTNFSSNVDDLIAAAEYLKTNHQAPTLIIGHSLGGAASIFAASTLTYIKAVATIGAPASPRHLKHLFVDELETIMEEGFVKVDLGGRPFTIKKQFIEDLESKDLSQVVAKMKKPIIIFHSPQDQTVGIENAASIYQAAHHPKSFISLDGADHLLTAKADSRYVGNMIAQWAERYLDVAIEDEMSTNRQVVVELGDNGYTTKILAEGHRLIADEPERLGGNNFGATPYGLVTAGLGACTAITLKMYAQRKQWDLQEVKVHLNYNRQVKPEAGQKSDHFNKEIQLEGNLTQEQKERLMEIADKCPVNKTLKAGSSMTTSLIN